jgi:cellulase/cellobiase CelA1
LILPTAHAQALGKNTCLPLHQRPHPRKAKKKVVGVESVFPSPKFKSIAAQCPMYCGFLGKFFYI